MKLSYLDYCISKSDSIIHTGFGGGSTEKISVKTFEPPQSPVHSSVVINLKFLF